ncbi:hypothetical protein C8Q76DRAFT_696669 [Earliella scabrosa]|nr:hypothetical protein C8Q76DRAFT_696669 [Earliella scabrosa]
MTNAINTTLKVLAALAGEDVDFDDGDDQANRGQDQQDDVYEQIGDALQIAGDGLEVTGIVVEEMEQSRGSDSERGRVVHTDAACDGCGDMQSIAGVRHKCLQCEGTRSEYDLCGRCVSTPAIRHTHPVAHTFFPIVRCGDLGEYAAARRGLDMSPAAQSATASPTSTAKGSPVQHNAYCDLCRQHPLVGTRHNEQDHELTWNDPDYDLCTACICSPSQRAQHDVTHAFFPISVPGDLAEYGKARARRPPRAVLSGSSKVMEQLTIPPLSKNAATAQYPQTRLYGFNRRKPAVRISPYSKVPLPVDGKWS